MRTQWGFAVNRLRLQLTIGAVFRLIAKYCRKLITPEQEAEFFWFKPHTKLTGRFYSYLNNEHATQPPC